MRVSLLSFASPFHAGVRRSLRRVALYAPADGRHRHVILLALLPQAQLLRPRADGDRGGVLLPGDESRGGREGNMSIISIHASRQSLHAPP